MICDPDVMSVPSTGCQPAPSQQAAGSPRTQSRYGGRCPYRVQLMFVPMVNAPEIELGAREVPPESRWFIVDRHANVLLVDGLIPEGSAPPVDAEDLHLLGRQDGAPVLAGLAVDEAESLEAGEWLHLRRLYGTIDEQDWALAGRAVQIINWDLDHRFCGRCGNETAHHGTDRARV